MQQEFITKCDMFFIAKCVNYYKIRSFLLQNMTVITKCAGTVNLLPQKEKKKKKSSFK